MKVARKGLKAVFVGKRLLTWSKLYFTDEKRDEANTGISGSLDKKCDKRPLVSLLLESLRNKVASPLFLITG